MNTYKFEMVGRGLDIRFFTLDAPDIHQAMEKAHEENPGYVVRNGWAISINIAPTMVARNSKGVVSVLNRKGLTVKK